MLASTSTAAIPTISLPALQCWQAHHEGRRSVMKLPFAFPSRQAAIAALPTSSEQQQKADLSSLDSAVNVNAVTKTGHSAGIDSNTCCTSETGYSMFAAGKRHMNDSCHAGWTSAAARCDRSTFKLRMVTFCYTTAITVALLVSEMPALLRIVLHRRLACARSRCSLRQQSRS